MKTYIPTITALRGLASLLVCLQHLIGTSNLQGQTYLAKDNFLWNFYGFGASGVFIFFTISGFVVPYSLYQYQYKITSFFRYLARRMLRLDPPYWLRLISVALIIIFLPHYKAEPDTFEIGRFLAHLFYLNWLLDYQWFSLMFWTLEVEFQFYVLIGLCYGLFTHTNKIIQYFSLVSFAIAIYFTPNSYTVLYYGDMFFIGILAFLYYTQQFTWKETLIFLVLIILISFTKQPLRTLPPAFFTVACILYINIDTKITNFLGKISYSLYLTHATVGQRLIFQSFNFIHSPILRTFWVFFAIALAILVAYIYYLVIEKPFMKLSKKIIY
jgi:peptidoglycan/LPS O-acetylase OafA/YrhL